MPDDWVAVGKAITERLDHLGMQQKELAAKSDVSTATIREIQAGKARRRSPRILRDISAELGWPGNYLGSILRGQQTQASQGIPPTPPDDQQTFLARLAFVLEHRLGPIVDVLYHNDSKVDVTIEIRHSPANNKDSGSQSRN